MDVIRCDFITVSVHNNININVLDDDHVNLIEGCNFMSCLLI